MLPEGLYLNMTEDNELAVFDAQDVCWLIFQKGGEGDPIDWIKEVVMKTCKALGVEVAYDYSENDLGDEVPLEDLPDHIFESQ